MSDANRPLRGLARLWPHDRAHWFFSRARWNAGDLGLAASQLTRQGLQAERNGVRR
jgi:hypothetical protein